tara:strand:- start:426 stop:722 length:297 start_codon:yes stop_codon:yes gene_type:complete
MNPIPFEHRLATKWLESKHNYRVDLDDLIESHSELIKLIGDFTLCMDILVQGLEPKRIDPDDYQTVCDFVGSLKYVKIEKHGDLGKKLGEKYPKLQVF